MGFLESIFNNDKVKELAFGQLRKFMMDEGVKALVLLNNPAKKDGPLPGFDVHLFKHGIEVFEEGTRGISEEQLNEFNALIEQKDTLRALMIEAAEEKSYFENISTEMLIALHDPEVQEIINRYLKAKKVSDGNHTAQSESY